jgi:hypothetical protein
VNDQNEVHAKHLDEYRQRPFQRIGFDVDGYADAKDITNDLLEKVKNEVRTAREGEPAPIVEITLRGRLGFPNSLLELQKIRDEAKAATGALHIRIKNNSVPIEYAVAEDMEEDAGREKLERRVIEDLIIRDNRYKTRIDEVTEAVVGAKRLVLSDEAPEKIAEFISMKTQ